MKPHLPLALFVAALLGGGAAAATAPSGVTPSSPPINADGDLFAWTDWDDDDDDRRRYGRMPRPDANALRAAGFVRVSEVERDDGRLEIEGYDRNGRELKAVMDVRGQRVLHVRYDDDDDRWDRDRRDARWNDQGRAY